MGTEGNIISRVVVGFGSNIGARSYFYDWVYQSLMELDQIERVRRSSLFETSPVCEGRQPHYLNGIISFDTLMSVREVFAILKRLEENCGRRRGMKWGARTLDLDLLFFGDLTIETVDLTVPHPRISDRGFVILPLSEIEPDLIHPVLKLKVSEMKSNISKSSFSEMTRFKSFR